MAWTSQEDYEAQHGTQAAQAAKQSRAVLVMDGPWRLTRLMIDGDGMRSVPLDNSVRSTTQEIKTLQAREYERTGIQWDIEKYSQTK